MAGFTNRGKYVINKGFFQNSLPASFKLALCTSAVTPTADTNTLSQLTEIAAGNGYTAGGYALSRNATDFDVLTEDDTNDRSYVQIKDVVWTASGGPIPASGNGARWAVLVDIEATPQVIAYFDLTADRTVSDGQTLKLENSELRLNES